MYTLLSVSLTGVTLFRRVGEWGILVTLEHVQCKRSERIGIDCVGQLVYGTGKWVNLVKLSEKPPLNKKNIAHSWTRSTASIRSQGRTKLDYVFAAPFPTRNS